MRRVLARLKSISKHERARQFSFSVLGVDRSLSGQRWVGRDFKPDEVEEYSRSFGFPAAIGQLLSSRGVPPTEANSFLEPSLDDVFIDTSKIKDMDVAVDRIIMALQRKEQIAIFGDYDVDGACSSAILFRYLTDHRVGGKVRVYIPNRATEGYGPNHRAFRALKAEGASVLITVDCGMVAHDVLSEAKSMGMDVVVVDHHLPDPNDPLPPAVAVVNPNRLDESPEMKRVNIAACGVSFLLVHSLNQRLHSMGWFPKSVVNPQGSGPDLNRLLEICALGTVCDVMPLVGLNRALVKLGLAALNQRSNTGLRALAKELKLVDSPNVYQLGFMFGPCINAGGRVGPTSDLGARLLSLDNESDAASIAKQLNALNQQRKLVQQQHLDEALLQAEEQAIRDEPIICVAGDNWHGGVIGIVAGRLKEQFHRPAFVVSFDSKSSIGKGSARSVSGVDLGSLIHQATHAGVAEGGGGHAMAAGFSVRKKKFAAFQKFMAKKVADLGLESVPSLSVDSLLSPLDASDEFVRSFQRLSPFGVANPSPRFVFPSVRVTKAQILNDKHVRCVLRPTKYSQPPLLNNRTNGFHSGDEEEGLSAIAFNVMGTPLGQALVPDHRPITPADEDFGLAAQWQEIESEARGPVLHVVGALDVNVWRDRENVQLTLEDAALTTVSHQI